MTLSGTDQAGLLQPFASIITVLVLTGIAWLYGGIIQEGEASRPHKMKVATVDSPQSGIIQDDVPEIVIAVMGVTGSGKSTFIQTMTKNKDVHVGHSLESATSEVNSYHLAHNGIKFVLVDTPGFNDTTFNDEVIMTRVLKWLDSSFRTGTRLNGLIYLHRIIDPKIQGSALSNMRMFRKLCGPECFQNIILATTFWADVAPDLGNKRERQLKENSEFWGTMVKKGSQVVRLGTDRDSGLKVLMDIAKKNKITLRSQHEMVMENKSIHETTAVQAVSDEILQQKLEFDRKLEKQRQTYQKQMEQLKIEKQRALERERERLKSQERERARLAAIQKQKEDEEWAAEHKRKQDRLREERERAEKERKKQEAIEERRKQILAAQHQREEDLRAERKRYYDNYTCQRLKVNKIYCDKCYTYIKSGHYWHCCHCEGDNHDECDGCSGPGTYRSCGVGEHPWMEQRYVVDDDCVVM